MSAAARGEAVEYRRRGWSPIPIKERSKEPNLLELQPYLNRQATKEELDAWRWSGVGIVTGPVSGVLILDVDGPEGEAELKKHGHPGTPMVRTASGGLHLYFKHPAQHVRTGIRVAPGLDVKASGGYVVAPPSVGSNGRTYEWIVSPEEAELADPPRWLMALLERERPKGPAPEIGERIPPGERNDVLTSLAGTMRRRAMGEAEILAALEVTNEQRCQPPLEPEEVAKIAASVAGYEPADDAARISLNGHGKARPLSFNLTDLGNAERFVRDHGEDVHYCYPWGKWLVWAGARWERDDAGGVHRLAKETVRGIYREAADAEDDSRRKALAQHATRSEAESKIRAMLELAKSELPVSPDELDDDPWLLNAENGTIDLRSGELHEHRRGDLITKMAPVAYDPNAAAPAWGRFLERVLPGEDLRAFVRRASGYSTTGDTSEQCMFINHGAGNNGKSTFQEAIVAALGDYSMRAPTEMLMAKRSSGVPNDVARLKGARFVTASETEEGRRLAESLVKDLTGQDTISARFMRAEFFDFRPTHKLWLSTNHKPEIRGTDNAIWRRIRLIPWAVTVPPAERDRKLPEGLRAELSGILAWIVRGCLEWHREGLQAPDEVRQATREYRAEMDVLAAFVEDRCVVHSDAWVRFSDLWTAWQDWCEETGEKVETKRRFGSRLTERGFEPGRGTGNIPIRPGIGLRDGQHPAPEDDPTVTQEGESYPTVTLENPSKSAESLGESYPSYPETHINSSKTSSRGLNEKNGNSGNSGNSEGSVAPLSSDLEPGGSATVEQLQRIRKLVDEGMAESAAREEVLGKGWVP